LKRLMMMENKLSMSSIWKYRLANIGNFSRELITKFGGTGVLARSTGLKRDLRISFFETYANYYYLNIRTFVTQNGDCYDRYLIRMREMAESAHIVLQVVNKFNLNYFDSLKNAKKSFKTKSFDKKIQSYMDFTSSFLLKSQKNFAHLPWYISMEDLIHHFKYYSEGLKLKNNSTYKSIEAPKGEFGVFLVSDGSNKPFRCKVRSSSYHHLQSMSSVVQGHYLSDLVTMIGSQDIVLGEIDR
jgi:NADH:ubiquinone oxidoreductase subunit D